MVVRFRVGHADSSVVWNCNVLERNSFLSCLYRSTRGRELCSSYFLYVRSREPCCGRPRISINNGTYLGRDERCGNLRDSALENVRAAAGGSIESRSCRLPTERRACCCPSRRERGRQSGTPQSGISRLPPPTLGNCCVATPFECDAD